MCYLLHGNIHAKFCIFHAKGLFMSKIQCWCRANAMLAISLLAAAATAFLVPPDRDYLGYYDLKTLSCLFSVLAVVGALRDLHIFSVLSQRMVRIFSTVRGVCTASERHTLPLLGLGRVCSRRTQRAFGTAMRSCASLSRGVAAPLGCVIPLLFLSPHRWVSRFSLVTAIERREHICCFHTLVCSMRFATRCRSFALSTASI